MKRLYKVVVTTSVDAREPYLLLAQNVSHAEKIALALQKKLGQLVGRPYVESVTFIGVLDNA